MEIENRICIRAFYRFFSVDDIDMLRQILLDAAMRLGILGTILVAPEGINGTIAAPVGSMDEFWGWLTTLDGLANLDYKDTFDHIPPFQRLKVRPKKEIVTLRRPDADPSRSVGHYVEPADWNRLIEAPDVFVIDTRNRYEFQEGTFRGALDPGTEKFGEFPAWAEQNLKPESHPRVAMFCTGGIRCEKATALLIQMGFSEVYHLRGGILKYLKEIPAEESLFEGSCFVFDDRRGVDEHLAPTTKPGQANDNL